MRSDKLPELPTPWNLQNLLSSAKEIYDSLQHSNWKYPYLSFFLLEMYFYKIHLSINCNFRTIIWNVSIYFRNPPPPGWISNGLIVCVETLKNLSYVYSELLKIISVLRKSECFTLQHFAQSFRAIRTGMLNLALAFGEPWFCLNGHLKLFPVKW